MVQVSVHHELPWLHSNIALRRWVTIGRLSDVADLPILDHNSGAAQKNGEALAKPTAE
jgi:hypothetical protein